ncbi:hypothetical protein M5D96_010612 [Drosophila gunungcola]|uniref:Uncharacterized protein n=1 Tax=Drosophila gunungcola TaxID=103775 RepID=A0A9P9YHC7_9MUSC|nr:hypothetical protein M5D96_010612 [Drosophila gunungcola]
MKHYSVSVLQTYNRILIKLHISFSLLYFLLYFLIIIFSESQRRDGYRFTDHFKDLRLAFTRAKNKTYKGKSMAKKMREDENGQE